jgi:hypothetical protein
MIVYYHRLKIYVMVGLLLPVFVSIEVKSMLYSSYDRGLL